VRERCRRSEAAGSSLAEKAERGERLRIEVKTESGNTRIDFK
jgi:hypothetical protein